MTYIIVDFEATCCNTEQIARDEMEIIEIGAVALHGNGPFTLGEFQSFVKPVRHTQLTAFCKQLTNIPQQEVDSADAFGAVMERFSTWIASFDDAVFCSWGDYDKHQLRQDCAYHDVRYPFGDEHINIKKRFADNMSMRKPCGLEQALAKVGLEFEGQPHRGIDDARNMANLAPYLFF
ncbi:3'-5' exonuclease [Massilia rubra]|uniref:Exonuclease domain-containing protein n=1 Tax=Massilia rubra TaxID=2607910 RepID=A0ABX0LV72_9BURK|nr:3'-5' exonuclease [Massilia rubra]NHZ35782.1 exonuclease domain-containing protein [Massilia rubra]